MLLSLPPMWAMGFAEPLLSLEHIPQPGRCFMLWCSSEVMLADEPGSSTVGALVKGERFYIRRPTILDPRICVNTLCIIGEMARAGSNFRIAQVMPANPDEGD